MNDSLIQEYLDTLRIYADSDGILNMSVSIIQELVYRDREHTTEIENLTTEIGNLKEEIGNIKGFIDYPGWV